MKQVTHVIGLTMPNAAGHGINFFNVAFAIASDNIQIHALTISSSSANQYMRSCGQPPNSNIIIEVLANGTWEHYKEHSPSKLFEFIFSTKYQNACTSKIQEIKTRYQHDNHRVTTLIVNPLLVGVLASFAEQNHLSLFTLYPNPMYMLTLANACKLDDDMEFGHKFYGIGGVDSEISFCGNDAPDVVSPLMMKFAEAIKFCDGAICSGTNVGIEGANWKQPHLPKHLGSFKESYLIGPLLPQWFVKFLDEPERRVEGLNCLSQDQLGCIDFMDKLPNKSCVFVSVGSHADLSVEQAVLIASTLSDLRVPFVILKRENKEQLVEALEKSNSLSCGYITEWAPQLQILSHPSIKLFISHAGFGSMIEGIFAGVPFITAENAADQFLDSKILLQLGASLGSIAVNKHRRQQDRTDSHPALPDDGGKHIRTLFQRVFASEEGQGMIKEATQRVLEWRSRILRSKEEDSIKHLEKLKQKIEK
ncbi:UDP-glycosyltransferase [Acrasis kona]|uniref:UDP-glycosyltransferase n=1 Tax=Acrasis kona TaxID=1008807 RepID=A0AAW2ZBB4_9EUKA